MPHKTGPGTYKGFQSPETGGWPDPIRTEVRKVYGAWRSKHPGENRPTKARGARIAWAAAKRKYPEEFRQHLKDKRRLAIETRQEMKEHPWAGPKTAQRIAQDHIDKNTSLHTGSRRHRIGDLHAAARQERRWAKTAHNEAVSESARARKMKGNPVQRKDLERDAKIAADFSRWRKQKAKEYDMEAERIKKVTGG
jgi:hypothetical protein